MKKLMIGFLSVMLAMAVSASEKEEKNATETDNAAAVVLSGTVTDSGSGELLAGVEVQIEGTGIKAYTDFDGNFTFEQMKPGEYKLVASYISYEKLTESFTLNAKSKAVNIKLENPR